MGGEKGNIAQPYYTVVNTHTHTHTHTHNHVRCPPSEYHKLLDSIIKKQGVFHPTDKGTGVFISLRPLWGTIGKVKEENPLLFRKFTAECQKLGFPEIIRPCESRRLTHCML